MYYSLILRHLLLCTHQKLLNPSPLFSSLWRLDPYPPPTRFSHGVLLPPILYLYTSTPPPLHYLSLNESPLISHWDVPPTRPPPAWSWEHPLEPLIATTVSYAVYLTLTNSHVQRIWRSDIEPPTASKYSAWCWFMWLFSTSQPSSTHPRPPVSLTSCLWFSMISSPLYALGILHDLPPPSLSLPPIWPTTPSRTIGTLVTPPNKTLPTHG